MPVPTRFVLMAVGVVLFVATFLTRTSVDRALRLRDDPDGGVSPRKDALVFVVRLLGVLCLLSGLLAWVVDPAQRR